MGLLQKVSDGTFAAARFIWCGRHKVAQYHGGTVSGRCGTMVRESRPVRRGTILISQ